MHLRKIATVAAVGIALLVTGVLGPLIVHAIQPHVSQETATANAIRQLKQMNPAVTGYVLVRARYPLPSQLCHAAAAWIVHLRAPTQGGYATYDAYVVVNATNGIVSGASLVAQ